MELKVLKNTDLTVEILEDLYKLFFENMKVVSKQNAAYNCIYSESYKKEWQDDCLNCDCLNAHLYYEDGVLVSFILIEDRENESFIREFQIDSKHQSDGYTFKYMIANSFPKVRKGIDLTGDIWIINRHSRDVFTHIGASYSDGKYRIPYNSLLEWLNK